TEVIFVATNGTNEHKSEEKDMTGELLLKDEAYAIVGAAMEVHNVLGSGFAEAVYHEALEIEFRARGIPFESQKSLTICYKGTALKKEYVADFVCFGKIIVEIK